MTYDLTKITYQVVAVLSDGTKLNLETVAENIAWEENESEIAVRLNLKLRDVLVTASNYLATMIPLCTVIYLYADWSGTQEEIFRGTVWEWEHPQIHGEPITLTCYDMLYPITKSQDNKYFAAGTSTKSIISGIAKAWSIPIGTYSAQDLKHKKTLYKNKTVSAMITETLATAKDLGGAASLIRARKGVMDVIERGSNTDVYGLYADQNIVTPSDKYSMTDLVTRVVVVGKDDSKGRPKVEATLNGKTEYGILQTISSKGSSSLSDAKNAAKKILDEKGKPKRTTTLNVVEFPAIRKSDKVYVETDAMKGYFFVKGISHNATSAVMQMEVEPVE